jgi:hypothetical protein
LLRRDQQYLIVVIPTPSEAEAGESASRLVLGGGEPPLENQRVIYKITRLLNYETVYKETAMAKKPTTADAQLIIQLYDLRREAELRKARSWFGGFWPQSADDVVNLTKDYSLPENAWFRQVLGYWDMVASLVVRGALNEDLFFDNSAEMWFTLAKLSPFLSDIRVKMQSPDLLGRVEKLATSTKAGKERLKKMEARSAAFRKAQASSAKAS